MTPAASASERTDRAAVRCWSIPHGKGACNADSCPEPAIYVVESAILRASLNTCETHFVDARLLMGRSIVRGIAP